MSEVPRFVENLPSNFNATNFGSVIAHFDCLPAIEFSFFFKSFCYHLLGGTCEKCQKFFTLGRNSPPILKSKDIWSVFTHFNCLSAKGILKRNFSFSSYSITLQAEHVKHVRSSSFCREFAVNFNATNFGSVIAHFDCLPAIEFSFFFKSFCYHVSGGTCKKCLKFFILSRICRLTSIQRIWGRLLLILTVFRQVNFLF